MLEEWRKVPGFGGHYEASSLGRVRAIDRVVVKKNRWGNLIEQHYASRVLSPNAVKYGYLNVHIGVDGKKIVISVHRLVLLAFVGYAPDGCEACHNNGIASDNRPENLRWDTHFNNNQDRKNIGHYAVGEKHPMAKFTPEQVIAIKTGAVTKRQAMAEFGISNSQHHRIRAGQSWAHLNKDPEEKA